MESTERKRHPGSLLQQKMCQAFNEEILCAPPPANKHTHTHTAVPEPEDANGSTDGTGRLKEQSREELARSPGTLPTVRL